METCIIIPSKASFMWSNPITFSYRSIFLMFIHCSMLTTETICDMVEEKLTKASFMWKEIDFQFRYYATRNQILLFFSFQRKIFFISTFPCIYVLHKIQPICLVIGHLGSIIVSYTTAKSFFPIHVGNWKLWSFSNDIQQNLLLNWEWSPL